MYIKLSTLVFAKHLNSKNMLAMSRKMVQFFIGMMSYSLLFLPSIILIAVIQTSIILSVLLNKCSNVTKM